MGGRGERKTERERERERERETIQERERRYKRERERERGGLRQIKREQGKDQPLSPITTSSSTPSGRATSSRRKVPMSLPRGSQRRRTSAE